MAWHSDGIVQGTPPINNGGQEGNGLPHNNDYGMGGGWQVCFA
eukprot:SAG22_NODE_3937_length_1461_cov_5.127753_2_plen_43_part_00